MPTSPKQTHATTLILGAYFASGVAGLIYEIMATRALSAVVGGTALASQLVFSVFFAGLMGARGLHAASLRFSQTPRLLLVPSSLP